MKPLPVAVAVVLVLLGLVVLQRRAVDRAHDRRVRAEAVAADWQRRADSLGRVERVRVDTYTVVRTQWRNLSQTDTLFKVRPETLIVAADRALDACEAVVLTCQQRAAALLVATDSLRSALMAAKREARGCRLLGLVPCPVVTVGYGAVGAAGTMYHGPAVTVGFTLWGGR